MKYFDLDYFIIFKKNLVSLKILCNNLENSQKITPFSQSTHPKRSQTQNKNKQHTQHPTIVNNHKLLCKLNVARQAFAFAWNPMGGDAFAYSDLTIINSVSKLRPTSSIVLIRDMYYTIVVRSDRTIEAARSKNAGLSDATWVNLCVIVPG